MPTTTNGLPTPAIGPVAPTANAYTAANGTVTNRNLNSTYDAAGNLTLFGSTAITYDANNLQTAAGSNTYAYDGLGQRVSRTVGSAPTTYYVYDAFGQLSAEYSAAPVTTPPCVTCYLSYDHLGSSRMVTNSSAQIVALHDYAPFGQEIPAGVDGRTALWGAPDNVNQKFTGQERDSETNLDFFQARYMSSGLGRFMSPDPYNAGADPTNPQSWNGYGYVSGNPLNSIDPSGTYLVAPQPIPDPGDGDGNGVDPIWGFGGVIVLHGPGSNGQTNAGGTGGPGAPARTYATIFLQLPSKNPKCSTAIMQPQYTSIFGQMGRTLQINPLFIMSTALQESGWNLAHVYGTNSSSHGQPLNNLFGMTYHGTNNIRYTSVQASANAWMDDWKPYLGGHPQTIQTYVAALNSNPKHMYNSNPGYPGEIAKRYAQLVSATGACGTTF